MEEKTISTKIKERFSEMKDKIIDNGKKIGNWVIENPIAAATIIGCASSCVSKGYKFARLHEDKVHRARDFYDPRTGKTTRSKRNPKGWELDEIEFRYNNGESYNHILADMNLR